jgi:two-component system aerobic respiration control sensor histidine kinase ArcB
MKQEDIGSDTSAYFRGIMDASPCIVFVKDEAGHFVDGNDAFAKYMGVSSLSEIVGLTDYNFYDKQTADAFADTDRRVLEDPEGKPLEFLQTSCSPDGHMRYLRMKKMQSTDLSGKKCLLGVAIDETELHEALESARKVEAAKSFFFSTVSHDIRTPLNAIVGYSELLKLGYKREEDRQKALATITSSANMLQKLITDVLDLSKLETGTMELMPVTTDCAKLARDVLAGYAEQIKKKGLKLVQHIDVSQLIEIDAVRIRQILRNLVGNAVKYTEKGQIDVTVSYDDYERLTISVADTGCGIAPADQQNIADPYVKAGRRGRNGGAGFGLAIVKQLVSRMNGEMSMSSAPGAGSTFTLVIPNIKASNAQRKRIYSATQRIKFVVGSRKDRSEKKILVVEDSRVNLLLLRSMLARLGYTKIITAANGREALEKLVADPFITLVLTDVWMPEINGLQLAREIKTNPRYKNVKVFAVTADTEIPNDYAETGFLEVLLKPVTLETLGKVL